jgi:RNA polymerase sigma-54 factor
MNNISNRLELKQSQSLVMTPQLQQAIKLLQFNNVELAEFIEEELSHNPLLEKASGEEESAETEKASAQKSNETDFIQDGFDSSWTGNESETQSSQQNNDFDVNSSSTPVGSGGNHSFEDIENSFENRMSKPTTLREHLLSQLNLKFKDNKDRMIGALLIDKVDESGYLREDILTLSEKLSCSEGRIKNLLKEMRNFDPTGVFAYDLVDCLSLQLEEQGKLDEPIKKFLDNLDLLAKHEHKKLAEICGVNETYLKDMIEEIKTLNPKPAQEYDHLVVQTVIPDVLMKKLPKNLGGGWRVELNHETLPKVLINKEYYTEVAQKTKDKKDKSYLNEKLQSATWLTKALDQRAKTILKVASEIIEHQEGFFLYGIEYLKPLVLRDIAETIDMHESTVSRVTNNKYIGTPRGVFELKYFFSQGITGSDGEEKSSEAIKAKIKKLIDEEDSSKILSDDKLVERLKEEGINIARRTVAKYREALNIGSSVQRRREKKKL